MGDYAIISFMSGHSKWSTIKRKKEANDSKRSKIFSKLSRLITVAARLGTDIDTNPTLRLAVEKAKEARMPKENIERAIAKVKGGNGSDSYEEIKYEGYGPYGVAFLIIALTDNKYRTVAEIRNIFNKYGGNLGALGSTSYIFGDDPSNPSFEVALADAESLNVITNMIDHLEELDDVQEVFSNFSAPDSLMENL